MELKNSALFFFIFGIGIGLIIGALGTMAEYKGRDNTATDLLQECETRLNTYESNTNYDIIIPTNIEVGKRWQNTN